MQRFFLHTGILVALALGLVVFAARFGAAYAQDAPEPKSIPVRHEISGAHFAYQVSDNDSSDGCIRLAPDSVDELFRMVMRSEQVEIVYQPVALAVLADGRIFVESDSDPYEQGRPDVRSLDAAARPAGLEGSINWARAPRALVTVEGIARRIDRGRETESAGGSESE